jgi:hypothetical protein
LQNAAHVGAQEAFGHQVLGKSEFTLEAISQDQVNIRFSGESQCLERTTAEQTSARRKGQRFAQGRENACIHKGACQR